MKPPHQHKRVDLTEMKVEIIKKLGAVRSKQYFSYLSRFVNLKLSKIEFNKLCLRIVGRENLPLHNQFIRLIVKNACNAKTPPPKETLKSVDKPSELKQSLLPNGDIQKVPLEHCNGKLMSYSNSDVRFGNGDLGREQVHHPQENVGDVSHHQHRVDLPKRVEDEVIICSEDERKVTDGNMTKSAFAASSFSIGGLLDNSTLSERVEKIALMQGLKGVTLDCGSLLNKGLDSYLKGLISSGVALVGTKLESEQNKSQCFMNKHQANIKLINGVSHGHHHQNKLGDTSVSYIQENKPFCPVSLLDFKVAMELNPQQLGENWPLLLEKICTRTYGEE